MTSSPAPLHVQLLAVLRLGRPEIWMVTLLPVLMGYVLAAGEAWPGVRHIATLPSAESPAAAAAALLDFLAASWRLLLALVVMGPLLWISTLLINDVYDLEGDRVNPRKAQSPLVHGTLTPSFASNAAYVTAAVCIVAASVVGTVFARVVLAFLVLAWAYSVPPVRLKTRPGADVAVNALGIGILCSLAGWTITQPLTAFPVPVLAVGFLLAVAVYVPTTLVDHAPDHQAGYQTIATRLGTQRAYQLGWWAWILANALTLALAAANTIVPRALLPILMVLVPLLLYEYHAFIGRARDGKAQVQGVVLCSLTYLALFALCSLRYTGIWPS